MAQLQQDIDDVVAATGFSGVVRLDRAGRMELVKAYGLADRAHGIPMTVDTLLAVASGSKVFTALVVMALVERGVLDLTTPARAILGSSLPLIAGDVTVEHLLSHRSGIGDYLDEEEEPASPYPMPLPVHLLATTEQFLAVLGDHPTKFPAGQRFSYCNSGFVVLALVAERVSGSTFHELARELVYAPAGMVDTEFLRSDELPGRAALGYVEVDGHWRTNVFHLPVRGNGDGGAYTTVADVHRLWSALFEGRIVTEATLRQMLVPRGPADSGQDGRRYGLGLWLPVGREAAQLVGSDTGVSFHSVHDWRSGTTLTVISTTGDGAWPVADVLAAHTW